MYYLTAVDISAAFTAADADGVRRSEVGRPTLNLGKNQLRVTAGTHSATPPSPCWPPAPKARPAWRRRSLVPIRTRVVSGDGSAATDYAIALYLDADNPSTPTRDPGQHTV